MYAKKSIKYISETLLHYCTYITFYTNPVFLTQSFIILENRKPNSD
jgi:hypothetical protein